MSDNFANINLPIHLLSLSDEDSSDDESSIETEFTDTDTDSDPPRKPVTRVEQVRKVLRVEQNREEPRIESRNRIEEYNRFFTYEITSDESSATEEHFRCVNGGCIFVKNIIRALTEDVRLGYINNARLNIFLCVLVIILSLIFMRADNGITAALNVIISFQILGIFYFPLTTVIHFWKLLNSRRDERN